MALQTSGQISLNDIHVEASNSYNSGSSCSINDADIRGLIGKGSGATMSFNEWYGASSAEIQTVTVGTFTLSGYVTVTSYGYATGSYGSISDGTLGPVGNRTIQLLNWSTLGMVILRVAGSASNSGFTTMRVHTTNFSRSAATYSNTGTYTQWQWAGITTNPFGTSGSKQVRFT